MVTDGVRRSSNESTRRTLFMHSPEDRARRSLPVPSRGIHSSHRSMGPDGVRTGENGIISQASEISVSPRGPVRGGRAVGSLAYDRLIIQARSKTIMDGERVRTTAIVRDNREWSYGSPKRLIGKAFDRQ